jgi:hypothetical protein
MKYYAVNNTYISQHMGIFVGILKIKIILFLATYSENKPKAGHAQRWEEIQM